MDVGTLAIVLKSPNIITSKTRDIYTKNPMNWLACEWGSHYGQQKDVIYRDFYMGQCAEPQTHSLAFDGIEMI